MRLGFFASCLLALSACKEAPKPAPPAPDKAPAPAKTPEKAEAPASPAGAALAAYETVRAGLAGDDIEGAVKNAEALATAAAKASEASSDPAKAQLASVAESAKAMSGVSAEDAKAVRKSFGEVSKAVITLLSQDASLAEGLFAIKCPMAEGYQKWVQTTEEVSNPYFGKAMSSCGEKSDFAP